MKMELTQYQSDWYFCSQVQYRIGIELYKYTFTLELKNLSHTMIALKQKNVQNISLGYDNVFINSNDLSTKH